MRKRPRKRMYLVEVVGLAILLLATGGEIFLERRATSDVLEGRSFNIDLKLDYMWQSLQQIGLTVQQQPGPIKQVVDYNDLNDRWNRLTSEWSPVGRQGALFTRIRGGLYLVGAFLVLLAKYEEGRERYEIERRLKEEQEEQRAVLQ